MTVGRPDARPERSDAAGAEIVFHLGVHCTDAGRIAGYLADNAAILAEAGIAAPPPESFRPVVNEAIQELRGGIAPAAREAALIKRLAGGASPARIVLSHESLMGPASRILEGENVYPVAGPRIHALRNLFPRHRVSFALAVRSPARFLPAAFARQKDVTEEEFFARIAADRLHWSEVVAALRDHVPQAPFTVWRHEALPDLWPVAIAALLGSDVDVPVQGAARFQDEVLSEDGAARLRDYVAAQPPGDAVQAARVFRAFRGWFSALPLAPTRWDNEACATIDAAYEADAPRIGQIRGVQFLG